MISYQFWQSINISIIFPYPPIAFSSSLHVHQHTSIEICRIIFFTVIEADSRQTWNKFVQQSSWKYRIIGKSGVMWNLNISSSPSGSLGSNFYQKKKMILVKFKIVHLKFFFASDKIFWPVWRQYFFPIFHYFSIWWRWRSNIQNMLVKWLLMEFFRFLCRIHELQQIKF